MENRDDSIPDVNDGRSGLGDAAFKYGMILVVIALVIVSVMYFNEDKEDKKKDDDVSDLRVESVLPPIKVATPEKKEPPVNVNSDSKSQGANSGKKELTWQERKRLPPTLLGTGSANSNQPTKGTVKVEKKSSIKHVDTEFELISAATLPNLDFLITAGTYLDCDVENALNTQMPGMAVCHLPRDVYSDNGNVLLLPRGTKLTGESLSDVKNGQTRIAMIWKQAKTPSGVVVSLENSKGTDQLGRTGVEGYTENNFLKRFGAAIAISLLETVTQVASQNLIPRNGSGSNLYLGGGSGGGTAVVESILQQYQNIPISIVKNEGESIRVAINKNLDFSSVYELDVLP